MQVQFISSVAIIAEDPADGRKLFIGAFGLPLEPPPGDGDDHYVYSERIDGCKHFGVWPLREAAQACFGTDAWPSDRPVPQVSIEFDLESPAAVAAAAAELESKGYAVLHAPRTEPWGQTIARIQNAEGAIIGVSFTPWMHQSSD